MFDTQLMDGQPSSPPLQIEYDGVRPDQVIMRYMSLARALVMMASGSNSSLSRGGMFGKFPNFGVPTLAKLQADDPREGIPDIARAEYERIDMFLLTAERDKLLDKANAEEKQIWERSFAKRDALSQSVFLCRISWRLLSLHRAVWCWYGSDGESISQWDRYGKFGVAVKSTCENAAATLGSGRFVNDVLVSKVRYKLSDCSSPDGTFSKILRRPFILKRLAYKDEKEIRLVVKCCSTPDRMMYCCPPDRSFIKEIVLSPYLSQMDSDAIRRIITFLVPHAEVRRSMLLDPVPSWEGLDSQSELSELLSLPSGFGEPSSEPIDDLL
ncbi:MAG TPA: hypothetical protein PKE47_12600 [Verrucomicrobiota bacterium]|nr:hypothetical protein [Verrucomicrobiota bacterium]